MTKRKFHGNKWTKIPFAERLNAKIEVGPETYDGTSCWIWKGSVTGSGYGVTSRHGKRRMTHQATYEEWVGEIPAGMTLDHLCRRPLCCNPLHLEAVTMRENLMRGNGWSGRNARKTHCPQGHEYTDENTSVRNGQRHCRACHRERERARKARMRLNADVAQTHERPMAPSAGSSQGTPSVDAGTMSDPPSALSLSAEYAHLDTRDVLADLALIEGRA